MRLTIKGQVTVPKAVREALGILPHSEVEFIIEGNEARIRKAKPRKKSRGRGIIERMRTPAQADPIGGPMTTDEIMALTRGD